MPSLTADKAKLGYKKYVYKNFVNTEEVPNICFDLSVNWWPSEKIYEAMSDEEILGLPEKTGIFYFLQDEEEDIYNASDGKPIK